MNKFIEITVKFPNYCLVCNLKIESGEKALWSEGFGIKHINCQEQTTEDDTTLVIIDEDDKKMLGWN